MDATSAIFSIHPRNITSAVVLNDKDNHDLERFNELSINAAKYPLYYKKGLGLISCIKYILDNANSPYYTLKRRHLRYIRRQTQDKASSISYYCKLKEAEGIPPHKKPLIDNVAMLTAAGAFYNTHLL